MCPAIANSASCKICAVICFLHNNSMSAAEIHHELRAEVYSQNVMSEVTVRQ
jgi:NO-binding membrane sensor protein with MHYT domain